jgi:hypothetical protein
MCNLVDWNWEARCQVVPLLSNDLRPAPARLAACLLDPEAFVISAAMLKTNDVVVATMGVKNMGLGAPCTGSWRDSGLERQGIAHDGLRQTH